MLLHKKQLSGYQIPVAVSLKCSLLHVHNNNAFLKKFGGGVVSLQDWLPNQFYASSFNLLRDLLWVEM